MGWKTWIVGQTAARRRKAGVPEEVSFRTKPEIALEQITAACAAGLPRGVVLMDAGYGNDSELRADSRQALMMAKQGFMPGNVLMQINVIHGRCLLLWPEEDRK